jgi:putative endonuclease
MHQERQYYVYMLASTNRSALYTGITNDIIKRVWQHRNRPKGFTAQYAAFRLVYYETFTDVRAAIAREKQIKSWSRIKKDKLILAKNPTWHDLATDFGLPPWPPPKDEN